MKGIKLDKNAKIYVLCPAYSKTGGPELLHQLVKKLNDLDINATITYFDIREEDKNYRNSEFDIYTDKYSLVNEIEDKENNVLIIPEILNSIHISKKFKKIQKIIWWLSVDNFLKGYGISKPLKILGIKAYIKMFFKGKILLNFGYIRKIQYHLCQSYYAIDFLKNKKIKNISYLSDYINKSFLETNNENVAKEDIILYNPKKGLKFTKKIMEQSKELNWVPIQNLTTKQVRELLLKSKVYIDFGNHPGKDRFPREAAMCGCCVITGKRGSANFYEDVPIEAEFKYEDKQKNIPKIVEKIQQTVKYYDKEKVKFNNYITFIKNEERQFEEDVKKIFTIKGDE